VGSHKQAAADVICARLPSINLWRKLLNSPHLIASLIERKNPI